MKNCEKHYKKMTMFWSLVCLCVSDTIIGINDDGSQINCSFSVPFTNRVDPLSFVSSVNMAIENLAISDIYSNNNGGCFHFLNPGWLSPLINVKNMSFRSVNSSVYGGALYFNMVRRFEIIDTSFSMVNASFGGAFVVFNTSMVTIRNIDVVDTKAVNGPGGAAVLENINNTEIIDSRFINGFAKDLGGFIYSKNTSFANIQNSTFSDGNANDGGSLHMNGISVLINSSLIENSRTKYIGGAMFVSGTNFSSTNTRFVNNTALTNGGAIASENFHFHSSGSLFERCSGQNGGAIYHSPIVRITTFIADCNFISCRSSSSGGAIYIRFTNNDYQSRITDSSFYNCTSSGNGGAIYLEASSYTAVILISKVCASQCLINTNANGIFCYSRSSSTSRAALTVETTSVVECGKINTGYACWHMENAVHSFNSLNCSKNTCYSYTAYYSNSHMLSIQFSMLSDNNASSGSIFYMITKSSALSTTLFSNIINNRGTNIHEGNNPNNAISHQNCLFMYNTGTLFSYSSSYPFVRSCYIFHTSGFGNYNNENSIIGSTSSQLITMNLLATFFCPKDESIMGQDIPCPTIPPAPTPINWELHGVNSLPPSPTECSIITNGGMIEMHSFARVLHFLFLSLISFMII